MNIYPSNISSRTLHHICFQMILVDVGVDFDPNWPVSNMFDWFNYIFSHGGSSCVNMVDKCSGHTNARGRISPGIY